MAYSPIEESYMNGFVTTQFANPEPEPVLLAQNKNMSYPGEQFTDTGGGAAVGTRLKMPSGLNTPENIQKVGGEILPAGGAMLKGAGQASAGMYGDIEGLGRMVLNYMGVDVNKETKLPTTEDVKTFLDKYIPVDEKYATFEKAGELASPAGAYGLGKAGIKAIKSTKGMPVGMSTKAVSDTDTANLLSKVLPIDKVQRSKNYKAWSEGADIKDEAGKPVVLYHGTTHDFDTFTVDRANMENHYGEGFYLTDKVEDANRNYAGVGPDLNSRIERRIDELDGEFADPLSADDNIKLDAKRTGVNLDLFYDTSKQSFNDIDKDTKRQIFESIARKELTTNQGTIMPVFAKMKNPVKVGTKDETRFSIDTTWDDETGDLLEESGNGIDLLDAVRNVARQYDYINDSDVDDAVAKLSDALMDGATAGEVDTIIRDTIMEVEKDGKMASAGQFISDVFKELGYDGIIMNAEKYFGSGRGMKDVEGAKHYILFEPTSIKSAIGNKGTFDPKDPSVVRGAVITGGAGASQKEENK